MSRPFTSEEIDRAWAIISAAKRIAVAEGEALYLVGEEVVLGKDGCQPSNSMCLAVGPTDDEDWDQLRYAITMHFRERETASQI